MTIAVKKSGSWTAGQGMKMTGTGVGMKVNNSGPALGSATNPYMMSLSATPFTFNIDTSVESGHQAGQYVKIFKVTIPAGQIVTIDAMGDGVGFPAVRAWMGASTYAGRGSGTIYYAFVNDSHDGFETRVTLNNSASASPTDCIFEVAAVTTATISPAQVRVQQLPALLETHIGQLYGRMYSSMGSSMTDMDGMSMWQFSGMNDIKINLSSGEWSTPSDPKDYFIYQKSLGGSDSSKYFRMSIDNGSTWTDQGASQVLTPDAATGITGWAIDLRSVLGSISSGNTFTFKFQSSADGVTWSNIIAPDSNPLSVSVEVV